VVAALTSSSNHPTQAPKSVKGMQYKYNSWGKDVLAIENIKYVAYYLLYKILHNSRWSWDGEAKTRECQRGHW
jgi:sugar phosphate permease